jgi:tetratricopeptide (TPR) repeat protein
MLTLEWGPSMTTIATNAETFRGTKRFSIVRKLGSGGMGVVYLAYDRESERQVALKTLHTLNPGEIYRLKNEFRALAGLSHPNLAQLYELVADGDHCFFTMEFVEGVDFFSYIHGAHGGTFGKTASSATAATAELPTDPGLNETLPAGEIPSSARIALPSSIESFPLDEGRLRPVLAQLVKAIHALHTGRMLHLDIKPSNVLVTREGRVVVLDFGLVTQLETSRTKVSSSSQPLAGGTPAYMAPEQALAQGICEASDWYGVGTMLFEVLTRSLPFDGLMIEVLRQKIAGEAPHPLTRNGRAPADLADLAAKMLRRAAEDRPTVSEIARAAGVELEGESMLGVREHAIALVGRESHAQALREAFDDMRRGNVVSAFVHGPSGMGKTALVQSFLEKLVADDAALVLTGRCYERESVPYKAFDSLIDELYLYLADRPPAELEALLPPHVEALARLFPVLVQLAPIADALTRAPVTEDAQEQRRQGFAALRELLRRLASKRSTVLFIDDLQWGDLDSAALLGDLLRPPEPPPLMLLGSYRSEEVATSPLLQKLLAKRGSESDLGAYRDVPVGPLTFEQARDLALRMLDPSDADRESKAESVAQESAGHPYFVSELVRDLNTGGGARSKSGVSLDETIQRHAARLPAEARELLEVVAVAGRPMALELVQKAKRLGTPDGGTQRTGGEQRALAVLQASHLIRTTGVREHDRIEAFHDRVRETVVANLEPARLKQVHAHLAATLEASGQADPEELAFHFQGARALEKAAGYASLAAKRAEEALAFDRAATFYRMALDLRGSDAPAELTQPLREQLAIALANAGRGAEAGNAYLLASEGADGAKALELRRCAAEQLLISGHIDAGLEVIRSVLAVVGLKLAPSPTYAVASIVARRLYLRLRGLDFVERKETEVPEEELRRIDICWSIAVGLGVVDNVRAADYQARHLSFALAAGEPRRVARALAFEIGFVALPGSSADAQADALLERSRVLSEKVDTPYSHAFHQLMSGVRNYLVGHWKKALPMLDKAEAVLRQRCSGVNWEVTSAHRFALGCLYYIGEIPTLTRRTQALLRQAEERGNLYARTDLRTRFTIVWLAADEPARAEREIEESLANWSHGGFHLQHFNSLMALGQKDLYTGDYERAKARLDSQMPQVKGSMLLRIQGLRIEVENLRGRIALALASRGAGAEAQLRVAERAAKALEKEGAVWSTPLGSLLRASVAAGRGDTSGALETLDRAIAELDIAGMDLYAAAARWRKGELTGGVRGQAMIEEAMEWMATKEVRRPERMLGVLAPGPWEAARP